MRTKNFGSRSLPAVALAAQADQRRGATLCGVVEKVSPASSPSGTDQIIEERVRGDERDVVRDFLRPRAISGRRSRPGRA